MPDTPASHDERLTHPLRHLAEAYNARDLDGLSALFDDDGALVPEPGTSLTGLARREGLAGFLELGGTMSVEVLDVVETGDIALTRTRWSIDQGNGTPIADIGAEVLRRQADGSWRFLIDSPFSNRAAA
ncbi:MAG: nuclear transport factor 2 family protein [Actinomycetota bacterium]|nr:nuclear transport factor 2 family protein [Actinomycetota bacterium]